MVYLSKNLTHNTQQVDHWTKKFSTIHGLCDIPVAHSGCSLECWHCSNHQNRISHNACPVPAVQMRRALQHSTRQLFCSSHLEKQSKSLRLRTFPVVLLVGRCYVHKTTTNTRGCCPVKDTNLRLFQLRDTPQRWRVCGLFGKVCNWVCLVRSPSVWIVLSCTEAHKLVFVPSLVKYTKGSLVPEEQTSCVYPCPASRMSVLSWTVRVVGVFLFESMYKRTRVRTIWVQSFENLLTGSPHLSWLRLMVNEVCGVTVGNGDGSWVFTCHCSPHPLWVSPSPIISFTVTQNRRRLASPCAWSCILGMDISKALCKYSAHAFSIHKYSPAVWPDGVEERVRRLEHCPGHQTLCFEMFWCKLKNQEQMLQRQATYRGQVNSCWLWKLLSCCERLGQETFEVQIPEQSSIASAVQFSWMVSYANREQHTYRSTVHSRHDEFLLLFLSCMEF